MSSHRPSGSGSHGHSRRPEVRSKAEAIKIELTDQHTPLSRLAEKTGVKSHFICKMKLRNECPGLPFEPKFLAYPSEQNRLTRYSCTNLEKNHQHSLLTEPDLGIHIDLIEHEIYEPPAAGIDMQPEDTVLLQDEARKRKMRPGLEGEKGKRPNVPWLHKTQYYGNEDLFSYQQGFKSAGVVSQVEHETEKSPQELAEELEKTFCLPPTLAEHTHPTKPGLKAVKMWDVLPDWNTWANDYTEIVFDHDPTTCDMAVAKAMSEEKDEEAAQSGLRKRKILGGTGFMHIRAEDSHKFFGYYLPAPDSKRRKRAVEVDDPAADSADEEEGTDFHCVREHQENEARKYMEEWNDEHYIFAFVDGEEGQAGQALYHKLDSRTYMRKCKDVISFDDLNSLDDEDLRDMRKRGNRFPKYFKGLQKVMPRLENVSGQCTSSSRAAAPLHLHLPPVAQSGCRCSRLLPVSARVRISGGETSCPGGDRVPPALHS